MRLKRLILIPLTMESCTGPKVDKFVNMHGVEERVTANSHIHVCHPINDKCNTSDLINDKSRKLEGRVKNNRFLN
jgi:hypothetical protein